MRFRWSSTSRRVRPKPLVHVPFYGRATLLAELERHVQRAKEGAVQFVALEGRQGSGKSALLAEFVFRSCSVPQVLLVQLHAGEWLLGQEFYARLFEALCVQSEKVIHTLYNETKRLRKALAVNWDEDEFCQILTSTDWGRWQDQPRQMTRVAPGRRDPLEQLLVTARQHPWAVEAAAILDGATRAASTRTPQRSWVQHWTALLQSLRARGPAPGIAVVLLIDQLDDDLPRSAEATSYWTRHWQTFTMATEAEGPPLLLVWAGTAEGMQPVHQTLHRVAPAAIYTVDRLDDEDHHGMVSRLPRVLPRPLREDWQRCMMAGLEGQRYPGRLILATTCAAAMAGARSVEEETFRFLAQADETTLINRLVQAIVERHPEQEKLLQQLLDVCAFLPPGKEFALDDILPLCDLDAWGSDVAAARTMIETLLGSCVHYGLLRHDPFATRYTAGNSVIQSALRHFICPETLACQTVARRRRLAAAIMHHVQYGDSHALTDLAQVMEADDGTGAPSLMAPYLVAPIRRILLRSSVSERQRIAMALGHFPSPLAVDLLMGLLSDAEGQVRSRAAQSLADLEGLDTLPALLKALGDSNSDVRWIVALALGKIEGTATVDALLTLLADEDKEVGRIAAEGLGDQGDSRAVPHLMSAVRDSYPLLRESAALALGRLADRRALPALQELLQDTNRQVRRSAEKALACFPPSSS